MGGENDNSKESEPPLPPTPKVFNSIEAKKFSVIPAFYIFVEIVLCIPVWGFPVGLVGIIARCLCLIYYACSFFDSQNLRVIASTKQFPLHVTIIFLDVVAVMLIMADLLPKYSSIVSNMVLLCVAIVIKTALIYPLTVYIDYLKFIEKYGDLVQV